MKNTVKFCESLLCESCVMKQIVNCVSFFFLLPHYIKIDLDYLIELLNFFLTGRNMEQNDAWGNGEERKTMNRCSN